MFKTITARYAGTCRRCGEAFEAGTRIRYGGRGRTYHLKADCGESEAEVVSTRCEDYPCCGHGPPPMGDGGGCPVRYIDGSERYRCTRCGRLMEEGASSAICTRCSERAYRRSWADEYGDLERDPDSFFYFPHR